VRFVNSTLRKEIPMQKADLLMLLQQEYQQWEGLLAQIGLSRMDLPGVNGDWSMKDIVAHLTGWNHQLVGCLQAAQRGESEPTPPWPVHIQGEDDINAWIYESNRGRSVQEVLDEAQKSYQQLREVIDALPDDVRIERVEPVYHLVWVGDQRFLVDEFFRHFYDVHDQDVRAWLAHITVDV
jgi:hypothetical protein